MSTPDPFREAATRAAFNLGAFLVTRILAAFAPLAEAGRWRSCRDSLPPMGDRVLIAAFGGITIASLNVSVTQRLVWTNANWHRDVPTDDCVVTHWCPLPETPKEQPHVE